MKLKQLIIGGVMVLCAGLVIFGLTKMHGAAAGGDEGDQEKIDPLITVQTGTLKRMTLHRYITGYGTVEPAPATADRPAAGAALSASAAGVIARVAVVIGQQVKPGDVLVELDSGASTFAYAKAAVERQEKLFADQNTSLKNVQDARSQLAALQIISPVPGTVTRLSATVGAAVDANAVIAEVIDLNRLAITAQIPAAAANDLKTNEEVQILTDPSVTASLSFISPMVETNDDTVLTRALLPPNSGLRPGQFVPLKIVTAEHTNCLAAPAESIVTGDDGQSALALVSDERAAGVPPAESTLQKATRTHVTTGLREDGWVEINGKDLKEGDSVVTVGAYGFPEQAKIRAANSPAEEETNSIPAP